MEELNEGGETENDLVGKSQEGYEVYEFTRGEGIGS